MVRDFVDACATPNGLFSRFTSKEYLYVHHVVLLNVLGLVVGRRVEYQIPRLYIFELQLDW